MAVVAIGLGTNLGDREANLQRAVHALARSLEVHKLSRVYETAPMYVEDQPAFLNAALLAETHLGPLALLRLLKDTESEVGRTPAERFGPREIDLDLLAYGSLKYTFTNKQPTANNQEPTTILTVPHPKLPERRFALAPLADLDPLMRLPGLGPVEALLEATEGSAASVKVVEHAVL